MLCYSEEQSARHDCLAFTAKRPCVHSYLTVGFWAEGCTSERCWHYQQC